MPPLAELQRNFAGALLAAGPLPFATGGRLSPEEALRLHRNTVLGALVNALRLSHPTVDALVGEAFFDQAASLFAQASPPRSPRLSLYGAAFAAFLENFPPCAGLPYLADVARLDFAIEQALNGTAANRRFLLEATIGIALPQSLAVLVLDYPADEIRAAIGDDAALAAITRDARECHVLVWRQGREARVRRVRPAAGRFLLALLDGRPAADSLHAADPDPSAALDAIQADIFASPFCTLISNPEGLES